jgi:peptide chain release factor subunit 1
VFYCFEPFGKINKNMYRCSKNFEIDLLNDMLKDDVKNQSSTGFVLCDGTTAIFALTQNREKRIIHKFSIRTQRRHNKGGQSALRFSRLKDEQVHKYVQRICEKANEVFQDVTNLVLAGSADSKRLVKESSFLDYRLREKIVLMVDTQYCNNVGLNFAIKESQAVLKEEGYKEENEVIGKFFKQVELDTGMYCYTKEEVDRALEMGAVKVLIVSNDLPEKRCYVDKYKQFGVEECRIVSVDTTLGSQFFKGFGGIGGLLRFRCEF